MGLRYRKSFKAGPLRVTASKSGISYSGGVKGARITKRADRRVQTMLSAPGTGLRCTNTRGKRSTASHQAVNRQQTAPNSGLLPGQHSSTQLQLPPAEQHLVMITARQRHGGGGLRRAGRRGGGGSRADRTLARGSGRSGAPHPGRRGPGFRAYQPHRLPRDSGRFRRAHTDAVPIMCPDMVLMAGRSTLLISLPERDVALQVTPPET